MHLRHVRSGGQRGADQGGLRAAKALGYETGGMVPKGCKTEAGPAPWLITEFGCTESRFEGYEHRTRSNVRESDATIIFCFDQLDGGSLLTREICHMLHKPVTIATLLRDKLDHDATVAFSLYHWIRDHTPKIATLNIAGNRESKSPGIGARVEAILLEALKRDRE